MIKDSRRSCLRAATYIGCRGATKDEHKNYAVAIVSLWRKKQNTKKRNKVKRSPNSNRGGSVIVRWAIPPPRCFSFLFCLTKPHTYRVVVKKNFKKWTRFSEGLAFVLGRRSTFLRHSRWALFLIVSNATASPNFSSRAHAVDPFFSHNFLSLHLVCWITHWIHCLWILIGFTGWYCFLILLKLFSRKDKWS